MADNIFTPEQQQNVAELISAFAGLVRETDPLIRAKIEENKAADKAKESLKLLSKQLGNTAIDYSKAVMSAGDGFGKFGGAVTGATTAIGDWASKLGVAGAVVGGFIKIFGEIAAKSLKQNDDLMKSYQNLSDMGSVAAGGFETLRDQLHSVGLMAEEAEKFERVLKPITGQLAMFGGSVSQGREQLTNVISGLIGPNNEMEKYLARLGYSTQDIREGAADFVQRQARLGLAQGKSQDQLTKEAFKYMTTLKELQELTGMSRDEAQKTMDAQMADARFALHLTELKEDEQRNLQEYMAAYEDRFSKEAAAGLKDLIVNQGRITTEAAAASAQAARNGYGEAIKAMQGGPKVFGQSLDNVASSVKERVGSLKSAFMVAENGLREQGLGNEMVLGAIKTIPDKAKKAADQMGALAETGKDGSKRLNQNIDTEQKARAVRIAGDKALYEVGNMTVSLFSKLNEVMFGFGKTVAKVTDFLSGIIPGMKKTNYAASFRDAEDNSKDLAAATKEKENLLKDIEATKKQIEEAEKGKVDYAKQIRDKQEEIKQINQAYRNEKDVDKKKELFTKESEEKRKLIELENMARQAGKSKDGGIDPQVALTLRENKLVELKERLANEEKKLLELQKEKEKLEPGATAKNAADAAKDSGEVKKVATTQEQKEFHNKMYTTLLEEAKKAGVANPQAVASLGAAQSALETGYGKSLAGGKNYFGIKDFSKGGGNVQSTKEFINGKEVTINDKFRSYGSMEESAADYIKFLQKNPRYKEVLAAKTAQEAIEAQGRSGYATDPAYASKLKTIHASAGPEIPKAKNGAGLKGPMSGYPLIAHGDESVWPDEELRNTLRQVQQTSLAQYKDELMGALGLKSKNLDLANENVIQNMPDMKGVIDTLKQELPKLTQTSAPTTSTADSIVAEVMSVLSEKLDALIEEHRKTNDIQDQILTYTRA